jgi:hypothetical protein
MEYTTPLSLFKSATEAFRYKNAVLIFSCYSLSRILKQAIYLRSRFSNINLSIELLSFFKKIINSMLELFFFKSTHFLFLVSKNKVAQSPSSP